MWAAASSPAAAIDPGEARGGGARRAGSARGGAGRSSAVPRVGCGAGECDDGARDLGGGAVHDAAAQVVAACSESSSPAGDRYVVADPRDARRSSGFAGEHRPPARRAGCQHPRPPRSPDRRRRTGRAGRLDARHRHRDRSGDRRRQGRRAQYSRLADDYVGARRRPDQSAEPVGTRRRRSRRTPARGRRAARRSARHGPRNLGGTTRGRHPESAVTLDGSVRVPPARRALHAGRVGSRTPPGRAR